MNISNEFIANSGYNMVILGHDHIQYPSKLCGSSLVVRPGSFSRGTAHYMNLVRGIDVADYSLDERTVEYVPVACKESKYVFSTSAFHKEEKPDVIISKVNEHMLSLVNSLERSDSKSKVYDVLDKFEVSQDVKKVIEVYLVNEGIYRTSQSKLN